MEETAALNRKEGNTRIAIGDIHGRDFWKGRLEGQFSECYFVGDYFDSFDIDFAAQYRNFEEICRAARADTRIKLCIGNHDFHYMESDLGERYSGFQKSHCREIRELLRLNRDILQLLYVTEDRIILSHAGLSRTFMERMARAGFPEPDSLNRAFAQRPELFAFYGENIYGDDVTQGPLWIRPRSLLSNALEGCGQIVGHTPVRQILSRRAAPGCPIVFIDTEGAGPVYRF